jgi:hypothetical protein
MSDDRKLRLIATVRCAQYSCDADIYIQGDHHSKLRNLIVQYGDGYSGRTDLPTADNGRREFAAGIPRDMTEQEILDHWLLWPMKHEAPYPKWEVPARVHGSPVLFRWWADEKPN